MKRNLGVTTRQLFLAVALVAPGLAAQAKEPDDVTIADSAWTSLWRNADQRGDALLKDGNAAAAAKTYTDPRRRAHAELLSGNYEQAAKALQTFDDTDAQYNRGNALAYAGKLQAALDAYDAALKRDPNNKDARHNRDLVANALQQKPPQESKSGAQSGQQGNSSDKNQPQQGHGSGKDSQKQGASDGQPAHDKSANNKQDMGGDRGSQGEKQDTKTDQSAANRGSTQPQPTPSEQASTNKPKDSSQDKSTQPANGKSDAAGSGENQLHAVGTAGTEKDETAQARRDAAASLNKDSMGQTGNAEQAAPAQPTEQQLAQAQWLSNIPDDPGGLLRRKFLIEHLMRQQKQ